MAFTAITKGHSYLRGILHIYHSSKNSHVPGRMLSTTRCLYISSTDMRPHELSEDELKKQSLKKLLPWNKSTSENVHDIQNDKTGNEKTGQSRQGICAREGVHIDNEPTRWERSKSDNVSDYSRESFTKHTGRKKVYKRENQQYFQITEAALEGSIDKLEEWKDEFGLLSSQPKSAKDLPCEAFADDGGEEDESEHPYKRLQPRRGKWTPYGYARLITRLCKEGNIYEATQVLEKRMLKEDRVRPTEHVFTALIGGMGRAGYTKMAFKLFNKMKKFGLQPSHATYTALFNACSNSPWKEDGLAHANKLRHLMAEKNHTPNVITYNAMIKAYGMLGDVQTAFSIMDEVIQHKYSWGTDTLSALLVACASQKEAGFKMAIEVWRRLRKKGMNPTTLEYNLLLRVVRDCGVGDPEFAQQLVLKSKSSTGDASCNQVESSNGKKSLADKIKFIPSLTDLSAKDNSSSMSVNQDASNRTETFWDATGTREVEHGPGTLEPSKHTAGDQHYHETHRAVFQYSEDNNAPWWQTITPKSNKDKQKSLAHIAQEFNFKAGASVLDMAVPDILSPRPRFEDVVELGALKTASDRLALLGGLPGILNHMQRDKADPDDKTFSLLVDIVPDNQENDVLAALKSHDVPLTVVICNQLIRKRNMRKDYRGAQNILALMSKCGLAPDVRTYGYCAFACLTQEEGENLLEEMEDAGILPTLEVYSTMLTATGHQFPYKTIIMKHMQKNNVQPDSRFIAKLEKEVESVRKALVDLEHGKNVETQFTNPKIKKQFGNFMKFYKTWLLSMKLEPPSDPWESFQRPSTQTLAEMAVERDKQSRGETA